MPHTGSGNAHRFRARSLWSSWRPSQAVAFTLTWSNGPWSMAVRLDIPCCGELSDPVAKEEWDRSVGDGRGHYSRCSCGTILPRRPTRYSRPAFMMSPKSSLVD